MSGSPIVTRLRTPQDANDVAAIVSACFREWPLTADEVAGEWARRDPQWRFIARIVRSDDGIAQGYGYLEDPGVAARPGRLRVRVLVRPECRGRGIGAALFNALLIEARALDTDELVTEADADDARAERFLLDRDFFEYHRRIESRLRLADSDPAAVAHAIDAHTDAFYGHGVRVVTYRQLQLAESDAARQLYELDTMLWADVPFGLTGTKLSFEQYEQLELTDPDFLPAATFIALDGARWIGLSALMRGRGFLLNSMTGVVRDWRGRGLARWLKLHTLRYAHECGAAEIRTFNDAINPAILALNRSLGFQPAATQVRYRRTLA